MSLSGSCHLWFERKTSPLGTPTKADKAHGQAANSAADSLGQPSVSDRLGRAHTSGANTHGMRIDSY